MSYVIRRRREIRIWILSGCRGRYKAAERQGTEMNEIVCSVVVPVYNEEEVIGETYRRLSEVMKSTGEPYEIIFVNDGSRDSTAALARAICSTDSNVKLIDFSRNFVTRRQLLRAWILHAGRRWW